MLSDIAGPAGVTAGRPDPEQDRLQRDFQRWRVWRAVRPDGSPGMWMANPPPERTDLTPTLMAETADGLRAQMADPGPRFGRPVARQAAP